MVGARSPNAPQPENGRLGEPSLPSWTFMSCVPEPQADAELERSPDFSPQAQKVRGFKFRLAQ